MLGFGVACLQSSVPISLLLMHRNMPRFPATATAFTLGTGIAIAALLLFIVESVKIRQAWFSQAGWIAGMVLLMAIFFFLLRRKPVGTGN